MAQTIIDYKDPLNLFGKIKASSNDKVNVKDILLPIISFIRLYSLKNQLDTTNSLDRAKNCMSAERSTSHCMRRLYFHIII